MISCNIDLGSTLKRLRKVPRDAARIMETVIDTDAKGFVRDVVAITPPSQGRATIESKKRGEEKIAADIRKVYGTPSDLWRLIRDKAGKNVADNFWAYQKLGRWHQANEIALRITGKHLDAFDGGAAHQSRRNRRTGRVTGGGKIGDKALYLPDNQERRKLKRYIAETKSHVGLLAAGFNPAALKLGVSLPQWIKRHGDGIGVIDIQRPPGAYSITITNRARHGSGADLPRRMQFVLQSRKRKQRLIHRINGEINAILKRSALTV